MKKIALICSIIASTTVFVGCGAKENQKVDNTSKAPVVESNAEKDNSTTNSNDVTSNEDEEKKSEGETESKDSVSNKETESSNSNKPSSNASSSNASSSNNGKKEEVKVEEAILYYYDAEADKMKSEVIKEEKVDENLILEKLKSKAMLTKDVAINKIDKKDKVAIIDFNSAFINRNLGSGVEANVLESIAKTFISGLKLEKLKITVDGKNYESGHIQLEDNYYFTK